MVDSRVRPSGSYTLDPDVFRCGADLHPNIPIPDQGEPPRSHPTVLGAHGGRGWTGRLLTH